ncbi:hypothetical protein BsWGS_11030 [Bradybaena similaris]
MQTGHPVIEATSILDYEDTDTGSSCRQSPVIAARQTPVADHPKMTHVFHKKVPDNSMPGVVTLTQHELPLRQVSSVDRPSSPVPTTAVALQTLHKAHTDNSMNKEDAPLVL